MHQRSLAILVLAGVIHLTASPAGAQSTSRHKSGKATSDQTRIGLYFADKPQQQLRDIPVLNPRFEIPGRHRLRGSRDLQRCGRHPIRFGEATTDEMDVAYITYLRSKLQTAN
jgi:hypothetical protein